MTGGFPLSSIQSYKRYLDNKGWFFTESNSSSIVKEFSREFYINLQPLGNKNLYYLIGRKFFVGKFRRQKIFVGKKFRHLPIISSLFADEYFSDKVLSNIRVFREIKAGNTINWAIITFSLASVGFFRHKSKITRNFASKHSGSFRFTRTKSSK